MNSIESNQQTFSNNKTATANEQSPPPLTQQLFKKNINPIEPPKKSALQSPKTYRNAPRFPVNLCKMISNSDFQNFIQWDNQDQTSFTILVKKQEEDKVKEFMEKINKEGYCRTKNLRSFQRQLNLYGIKRDMGTKLLRYRHEDRIAINTETAKAMKRRQTGLTGKQGQAVDSDGWSPLKQGHKTTFSEMSGEILLELFQD